MLVAIVTRAEIHRLVLMAIQRAHEKNSTKSRNRWYTRITQAHWSCLDLLYQYIVDLSVNEINKYESMKKGKRRDSDKLIIPVTLTEKQQAICRLNEIQSYWHNPLIYCLHL